PPGSDPGRLLERGGHGDSRRSLGEPLPGTQPRQPPPEGLEGRRRRRQRRPRPHEEDPPHGCSVQEPRRHREEEVQVREGPPHRLQRRDPFLLAVLRPPRFPDRA
ncbi:hypothetical protein LINPERPRIM_LOCUS18412, partial [Linum perenne]